MTSPPASITHWIVFCLTSRLICVCYATRFGLVGREIRGCHQIKSEGRLHLPMTTPVIGFLVVLAHRTPIFFWEDSVKSSHISLPAVWLWYVLESIHESKDVHFPNGVNDLLSPPTDMCMPSVHEWYVKYVLWSLSQHRLHLDNTRRTDCMSVTVCVGIMKDLMEIWASWHMFNVWLSCLSCRLQKEEMILYSNVRLI